MRRISKDDLGKTIITSYRNKIRTGLLYPLNGGYACDPYFLTFSPDGILFLDAVIHTIDGELWEEDSNLSTIDKNKGCGNCSFNIDGECLAGHDERLHQWEIRNTKGEGLPMPCHFITKKT